MTNAKVENRIAQGWKASRGWITSFDGSPTVTLLVGVPDSAMYPALGNLSEQVENFRISAIPANQPDAAVFIPVESFPEYLAGLRAEAVADLHVNFAYRSPAFDLDIHLTVFAAEKQQLILELVWWSDQVFSEEAEPYAQFKALMEYFIDLQKLFSASHLMLSSESVHGPGMEVEDWIEI